MRLMRTVLLSLAAIAAATIFLVEMSAQQALDNQGVIKLVAAKVSDDVVVAMINGQATDFSLSPDDIITLKRNGVSDVVLAAMLAKTQRTGQPPAATRAVDGDRPNPSQILAAIRSDPNRNDLRSPTVLVMSTTPFGARLRDIQISIDDFRIIRWGDSNGSVNSWPVELCVVGTAENRILANFTRQERMAAGGPGGPAKFETKTRYRIFKDDFGGFKAEQILVTEWKQADSVCPKETVEPLLSGLPADLAVPPDGVRVRGDASVPEVISKVLRPGTGSRRPSDDSTITFIQTILVRGGVAVTEEPRDFKVRVKGYGSTSSTFQLMVVGEKRRVWETQTRGPAALLGTTVKDIELIAIE